MKSDLSVNLLYRMISENSGNCAKCLHSTVLSPLQLLAWLALFVACPA